MPESDASGSVGTPLEQSEGVTRQQDPYRHPNLVKKPKEAPPYPIARLHALLISDLPSRMLTKELQSPIPPIRAEAIVGLTLSLRRGDHRHLRTCLRMLRRAFAP